METTLAIPCRPVCPTCNSRFFRASDDSNHLCPQCRDAVDGISHGSLNERLAVGFAMMESDDVVRPDFMDKLTEVTSEAFHKKLRQEGGDGP